MKVGPDTVRSAPPVGVSFGYLDREGVVGEGEGVDGLRGHGVGEDGQGVHHGGDGADAGHLSAEEC